MANFTTNTRSLGAVTSVVTAGGGNFASASRVISYTVPSVVVASGGWYSSTGKSVGTIASYLPLAGANYSGGNYSFPSTPLVEGASLGGTWATSVWVRDKSVVNYAWDSTANRFVSWLTEFPDPDGIQYPRGVGYGVYGVNTSLYACVGQDISSWNF